GTEGSGFVPLPVAVFDTMWFPSAKMLISLGGGLHGLPVQKFATAIPKVSLPVTVLSCTLFVSAARIRIPVPGGTAHTASVGSTHVFALSLSWMLLLPTS